MVRLIGRCLPMICLPKKKRQSLPITDQKPSGTRQHQEEINKLFVRRVESIRVTQQGAIIKHLPVPNTDEHPKSNEKKKKLKAQENKKGDDTEFDCETHLSDRTFNEEHKKKAMNKKNRAEKPTEHRRPLEKLFKKGKTPRPNSVVSSNPVEQRVEELQRSNSSLSSSMSSEWSTSTYSDSQCSEKSDDLSQPVRYRQPAPINSQIKHQSCVESFYLDKEHVRAPSPKSKTETKRHPVKVPANSKQVLQNVRNMMKDRSVQEQHFNKTRQRESVRL